MLNIHVFKNKTDTLNIYCVPPLLRNLGYAIVSEYPYAFARKRCGSCTQVIEVSGHRIPLIHLVNNTINTLTTWHPCHRGSTDADRQTCEPNRSWPISRNGWAAGRWRVPKPSGGQRWAKSCRFRWLGRWRSRAHLNRNSMCEPIKVWHYKA